MESGCNPSLFLQAAGKVYFGGLFEVGTETDLTSPDRQKEFCMKVLVGPFSQNTNRNRYGEP